MRTILFIVLFIATQTTIHAQNVADSIKLRQVLSDKQETIYVISYKDYKEELRNSLSNKTLYKECIKYLDKIAHKDTVINSAYFINFKSYSWSYDSPAFEKCKAKLLLDKKLIFINQSTRYSYPDIEILEIPYYACNDTRNQIVQIYYSIKASKTGRTIGEITKTYLEGAFSIRSCF